MKRYETETISWTKRIFDNKTKKEYTVKMYTEPNIEYKVIDESNGKYVEGELAEKLINILRS